MSIRPNDQRVLSPGMCFHLVPALYKADLGCVCCSSPIRITETEVEALTDIPAELIVVN
jgi:Xaa-Pro aminopeptidase